MAKLKKDKMVTILIATEFFDVMQKVVSENDDIRSMSDLMRKATEKEVNKRIDHPLIILKPDLPEFKYA